MDPLQFGHLAHPLHQLLSHGVERVEVVAVEAVFQFGHLEIVEPLEAHVGLGEGLAPPRLQVGQQVEGGLLRRGVDDELCVVLAGHLGSVAGHEARRRTADERRDTPDALVLLHDAPERVGHGARVVESLALGHEDLDGQLVAVGIGEESDLQRRHDEHRQQHHAEAAPDGEPGVGEGPVEHLVIGRLHPSRDGIARGRHLSGLDDEHLEERDDGDGQQERHHQVDRDRHGEVAQGVVEGALHRQQQGIEDDADAERRQHHRHEVLHGRADGGLARLVALADIFQIAVDDDDGVVDHHAQHHDEGGQRDDVELDAQQIHDGDADEGAQGDGDGRHDGRPQGEQHHHDQDDDGHRDEQVAQKVADAQTDHLGLVGNARDGDVGGQLRRAEVVEHAVDVAAVLHDVVAGSHLEGQKHAGVTVLLDIAGLAVVFAHHAGHVAHADHLARRCVAVEDHRRHLGLRVLRRRQVDGRLLGGVADAAAHGGQTLLLQLGEEHLLADAIGLQTLAVDVEAQLLLLLAVDAHVGHRRHAAQTVAQAVGVVLQLAIAALRTLDGDEQGAGVAEVVVGHEGQHALRQLLLEEGEAVLHLAPHLVLVVDVVVQPDHDHAHAVLGRRRGLLAVDFLIGEQIALQRTGHLLLHFLCRGSGIDGHYHALADGEGGEFVLGHDIHAIDAHQEQQHGEQQRDGVVVERPAQPLHSLFHSRL